jgi:predicted NBD/HSP70 family sugar kinase
MVDMGTGQVLNAPQLGWRNVDIRGPLEAALGIPGARGERPIACALARMWLGAPGATVPTDFVYVTVSDGIGAGVVVNGQVVRGQTNSPASSVTCRSRPTGPPACAADTGCLEVYTSNLATLCATSVRISHPRRRARCFPRRA